MIDKITELQKMLQEEPDDPFLHYALGLEFAKKKYFQEAMASFQAVLNFDENYVAAYYQLGLIFIELDIVDVAKTYILKGIKIAEDKKDLKTKHELEALLENIDS